MTGGRNTPTATRCPACGRVSVERGRRLTAAELAVLIAAGDGLSAGEAAVLLSKSTETVKAQRASVIMKLGARNMCHAIRLASEAGIFDQASAADLFRVA